MTMPTLLAQLYRANGAHHGVRWGAVIFGLLLLGLLVTIVVLLVRANNGGTGANGRRTAEAILSDRFARGEITEEEFIRRRNALRT